LLLIPLLIRTRRRKRDGTRPSGRDWIAFLIAGVGGQVLAQLGMTWGITKSLASKRCDSQSADPGYQRDSGIAPSA
jgi:hypothetical protein